MPRRALGAGGRLAVARRRLGRGDMERDAAPLRRHTGLVQRTLQLRLVAQQQGQRLGLSTVISTRAAASIGRSMRICTWPSSGGSSRTVSRCAPSGAWPICTSAGASCAAGDAVSDGEAAVARLGGVDCPAVSGRAAGTRGVSSMAGSAADCAGAAACTSCDGDGVVASTETDVGAPGAATVCCDEAALTISFCSGVSTCCRGAVGAACSGALSGGGGATGNGCTSVGRAC